MVAATRKMNEFKGKTLAGIDEEFNAHKTDILAKLKDQIKNELAENLEKDKSSNGQYLCFRWIFIIIKFQ